MNFLKKRKEPVHTYSHSTWETKASRKERRETVRAKRVACLLKPKTSYLFSEIEITAVANLKRLFVRTLK